MKNRALAVLTAITAAFLPGPSHAGPSEKTSVESIAVALADHQRRPVVVAYNGSASWQMCLATAVKRDGARIWFRSGDRCALPGKGRKTTLKRGTRLFVCVSMGGLGYCTKVTVTEFGRATDGPLPTLVHGDFVGNNEEMVRLADLVPITPEEK